MEPLHPNDPHHIGPYRLLSRLGAGGMGQVYLARSDRGRTVAVKLVHPGLAVREEFRSRFRQEVAVARRVGGTWTAPVLDADTEAGTPWFATGYVAGPSLRQVVARDFGPLPARTVRILAAGLAYALQDIHRAGLIHRDLKPSNVLLTIDGPRVIDFGIARPLEDPADGLTRPGELVGSPGFMAPEQVRGETVTPACDVFCLGAVLAYAATGRLPFGDAEHPGGAAGLLLRIVEAEPDLGGVPVELRDLVADCLRKDPAARPDPEAVLARVGAGDTVADGRALEPWLPTALVAQLGRQAVQLLDREDPGPGPDRTPRPAHAPAADPATLAAPAPAAPAAASGLPAPVYPYEPPPAAPPARPAASSTAFLVAVAVVVAAAAGGTVYAVMGKDPAPLPPPPVAVPTDPSGSGSGPGPGSGSASAPAAGGPGSPGSATLAGRLPQSYAGAWRAASGSADWRLTLTPGAVGDPVMTLRVEDPGYSCAWRATLRSGPDPVELNASTVTSGAPPTCTPGGWSRLRLLPDGSLRRELDGGANPPLTYYRE
ncbi:serine/threonine-protein kinase [Streptomyces sp. NBC_00091]|uniref:serine/threonine-protein kinase n=1 Tax=Streptomyces sp. NBC_00091 TaxID=2975648 RepID=UPI0022521E12|nr:serine/threonine-protein kinase [Streptomyces sp. NBC_00091]MCX5377483.1 serine/threonine protein kinase [Streptomyces sp. NBC_00091]